MAKSEEAANKVISDIEKDASIESFANKIKARLPHEIDSSPELQYKKEPTGDALNDRLQMLNKRGLVTEFIEGKSRENDPANLTGNIENFIGYATIPIGLAGPLLVNGLHAFGDYFIPLATTEGALVASYNRGMKATRMSGGIQAVCLTQGVQRSPYFKFDSVFTVGRFVKWAIAKIDVFRQIVSETSRHAKLMEMQSTIEGNSVIVTFEYTTGDASGQNMVTICTDKICKYILQHFDQQPQEWYIESNYSGDKKATALSFMNVRGKKVVAESIIKKEVIEQVLKTDAISISKYWQASTLAVTQSGSIGAQGHIANGLTALFIACGQDVACIAESSIGITRMEVVNDGDLYISVTIPSLIVGTVGGGTGLSTQRECLEMLECSGAGHARKFAEICASVALCGELSIAAAMSVDHFTRSHQSLGRKSNG
ncbi:MAG: 3-hydroxy-3-methylglutaryl-CoA reductase [Bacteroidetes bacterium]|nr:3-hydroxy-3-methylglutaryl-CoA reductase [Bacteroidota bacterium]